MDFTKTIEAWYADHKRDLPWRGVTNPYLVWVSEIILQQTQVAQGYDYYLRFVHLFPTVTDLAKASEDSVLNAWQGLGYYSRARHLHAAAQNIVAQGRFPNTYDGIRALKGVGDYTAAAIASMAFGLPYAAVDGNVYRVLSRFFGIDTPIDTIAGKRHFTLLAQNLLDKERPGIFNQALMDFGALQCLPKQPLCTDCPLNTACKALSDGRVSELPIKAKKTAILERHFLYVFTSDGTHTLLHKRAHGDIWEGLYEPLLFELPHAFSEEEAVKFILAHLEKVKTDNVQTVARGVKHTLTHRRIFADFYKVVVPCDFTFGDYARIPLEHIDDYPVPRLLEEYLPSLFL